MLQKQQNIRFELDFVSQFLCFGQEFYQKSTENQQFRFQTMEVQDFNIENDSKRSTKLQISSIQTFQQFNCEDKQKQNFNQRKIQLEQIRNLIFNQDTIQEKKEKTTNIPKFLFKYILRYYDLGVQHILGDSVNLIKFRRQAERIKKKLNNPKLSLLKKILITPLDGDLDPSLTRQMMSYLLKRYTKQEIILNNHVHDKKLYLVATKVFALRCQSANLIERASYR